MLYFPLVPINHCLAKINEITARRNNKWKWSSLLCVTRTRYLHLSDPSPNWGPLRIKNTRLWLNRFWVIPFEILTTNEKSDGEKHPHSHVHVLDLIRSINMNVLMIWSVHGPTHYQNGGCMSDYTQDFPLLPRSNYEEHMFAPHAAADVFAFK